MKTFCRLMLRGDIETVLAMGRANAAETLAHVPWSDEACRAYLTGAVEHGDPVVWVAERGREITGFLIARLQGYGFSDSVFTTQDVLYVPPEHRGSRAAIILMQELVRWSDAVGAVEIFGGNDNQFNSERTAKLLSHFGFKKVGYTMTRVRQDG